MHSVRRNGRVEDTWNAGNEYSVLRLTIQNGIPVSRAPSAVNGSAAERKLGAITID